VGLAPEVLIARAIEACHNYVLAVSPRSLADTYCLQGLLFALSLNKRIVPVQVAAVPVQHLPEPLQGLPMIDGIAVESSSVAPSSLVSTLLDAADYHQAHTDLLVRALRWERASRQPSLLLQGADLQRYQRWLGTAQGRSPYSPIRLQTFYVAESVRQRRDRMPSSLRRLTGLGRWFD
jgi:hypothetical protein